MKVAILFKCRGYNYLFCNIEDVKEAVKEELGQHKHKVLTKRQFFKHHYPKIKHRYGMKEIAKTLY